jgi:chromosome segregation ATPase
MNENFVEALKQLVENEELKKEFVESITKSLTESLSKMFNEEFKRFDEKLDELRQELYDLKRELREIRLDIDILYSQSNSSESFLMFNPRSVRLPRGTAVIFDEEEERGPLFML